MRPRVVCCRGRSDTELTLGEFLERYRRYFAPAVGIVLFAVALAVLRHALHEYHYRDIVRSFREVSAPLALAAVGLTALDYFLLSTFDLLGLRHVHRKLPVGKVLLTSFSGYALSHNVGFSVLTGGSLRYRFYSAAGMTAFEITELVAFCTVTYWLGFLLLGGVVFVARPDVFPQSLPIGLLLLAALASYLILAGVRRGRTLRLGSFELERPPLRVALGQVALSAGEWALSASAFYVLLPRAPGAGYVTVLAAFLVAQIAGIASQVPGGLGVFETVALLLLSPHLPSERILGALVAFRGIYYILPLFAATSLLGAAELIERREQVARLTGAIGRAATVIVPQVLALATLVCGAILLFSGATPAVHGRLEPLNALVPLPLIEISHFAGSLVGAGLIVLAQGIQRRLDAAWHLTIVLLGVGIAASLGKGLDFEEAAILGLLLLAMIPCRPHFRRRASLFAERFTPRWIATIAVVALGAVWLFLFAHKHLELSGEAFWHYSLIGRGEGSRSLRATVAAAAALTTFGLFLLLRPARLRPAPPGEGELERVRRIVEESPSTLARLALLGDKSFLFSESGKTFVMYGSAGRAWVALGDPVGPREEWADVAWKLREQSDLHGGFPVFYEASAQGLPIFVELGLTLIKLGEEARVPLAEFTLAGNAKKHLRATVNRIEKEGCTFEIVPRERVPAILPQLRQVSDAWLAQKATREKRFSLGRFDEAYLAQFPAAVLKREGRIVAFANVWTAARKEELSVDLMRFLPEAPGGSMDYLFGKLMHWGAAEGYAWFNLGMAPLSGLDSRALAPIWNRLGAFVFRQGEHFYNFQGIRAYKEKFDPCWEPRYLASPGGLALPRVIAGIAALTSGGLKGVVTR